MVVEMASVHPIIMVATTQTCQLAMVEPPKRDSGLTRSNSKVNYHPVHHHKQFVAMSTHPRALQWAVIWAMCTEIDRCPPVILDSA